MVRHLFNMVSTKFTFLQNSNNVAAKITNGAACTEANRYLCVLPLLEAMTLDHRENRILCKISNYGVGNSLFNIPKHSYRHIYDDEYRVDATPQPHVTRLCN